MGHTAKPISAPMLSIIIPTLQEECYIQKTLEQFDTLKTIPHECIISDGGSSDKTLEIAKKLTHEIIIHQGTYRQTIAQARNLGASIAKGQYLVFIDADVTIPDPETFFNLIIKEFNQDPTLSAVTTSIHVTKDKALLRDRLLFGLINATYYIINNVLGSGAATGEFQMIRHRSFKDVGGFKEDLVAYEDADIFIRLAKKGKTRFLSQLTIFHSGRRVHRVGHLKLLSTWITNGIWATLFKKAFTKEWEPIR